MASTKHILSRKDFDNIVALPKINWDRVSETKKQAIADRCIERFQELHLITEIEGVRKFSGGKYVYEKALMETMEILGIEISEEEREDLLIEDFLSV